MLSNAIGMPGRTILGFFIIAIIINNYTLKEFGQFKLFISFLGLTAGLSLGIDKVLQRYFPKHIREDKRTAIKSFIVFYALRIGLFFFILVILLIICGLNIIDPQRFDFPYFLLAVILAIIQASSLLCLQSLNSAFLEHKYFNSVYIGSSLLKLLFIYIFRDSSLLTLLFVWTTAEVLIFILFFYRLIQKVGFNRRDISQCFKQKLPYKEYFNYGKYLSLETIGTQFLSANITLCFLSYLQNNELVGIYGFATTITSTIAALAPSNLMFNITLPMLIKKVDAGGGKDEIASSMAVFLKLNLLFWPVAAIFLSFNLIYLIYFVFEEVYLKAIPLINILLLIFFAHIIKNVFEPVARALKKTKVLLFTFIGSLVNVISCYFFIPSYELYGAVLSTGLSLFVQSGGICYYTNKMIGLRIDLSFFLKLVPNIIILFLCFYYFTDFMNTGIIAWLSVNFAMVAITVILFTVNKSFGKKERAYINSFLPYKIFIF